jgi:hypothetical protein
MKNKSLKWQIAISSISAILFVGHLIWPTVKLDTPALFLLMLCFLPWLGSIFKSVELPGGTKLEYCQRLLQATKKVEDSGLLEDSGTQKSSLIQKRDPIYRTLIEQDPNLALAGLRIDIERKLRTIVGIRNPDDSLKNLSQVVDIVGALGLFTKVQTQAMHGILKRLNIAVHGGRVPSEEAAEVVQMGSRLLDSLDKRIEKQEQGVKAHE